MHELSICNAIVRIAEEAAGGRPVRAVNVDVGHLRQVVPETLTFCWDIAVRDGALAGSALLVRSVPAVLACAACGADTTITVPVLRCGSCGSSDATVTSGEELSVVSIELDDAAVGAAGGVGGVGGAEAGGQG